MSISSNNHHVKLNNSTTADTSLWCFSSISDVYLNLWHRDITHIVIYMNIDMFTKHIQYN